jgi:hypothetical protein
MKKNLQESRSVIARDLGTRKYRQRIVPNKKKLASKHFCKKGKNRD